MSGYVYLHGPCWGCGNLMSYNPNWVPSIPIEGDRKPICANCMARANAKRVEMGLQEHPIHPQAYEPEPEESVHWND